MQIQQHVSLHDLNTLALQSVASHFIRIQHADEIPQALAYATSHDLNVMVLSGGSNVLLPAQLDALIMYMDIQGIQVVSEDENFIELDVAAGENWHEFVCKTTEIGAFGLQNLALIPGKVGASPVQNIGAYGVEVGEFIRWVSVYDRTLAKFRTISAEECQFSYRHSIFKDEPTRYIIDHVRFRLLKQPQLKLDYGDLKQAVGELQTAANLQQQVIQIRQSKLPQPAEYPNVGSFFKNPMISAAEFDRLKALYPQLPAYPQADGQVKVAAGWLIDQAGWKGKRLDKVGMFHKQALVLVNYEDAELLDVVKTYRAVQQDVKQQFQISLEPEPVLYNTQGQISAHVAVK